MRAALNTLLSTLADPTRRTIFERLCRDGEQSVHALTAAAGVTQPTVSKHRDLLKRSGLVRRRRFGRESYYSARSEGLVPLVDWVGALQPLLAQATR